MDTGQPDRSLAPPSAASVFWLTLRAAFWRSTAHIRLAGLTSVLVAAVVLAALRITLQFLGAGAEATFNPYGLNAAVAWIALALVAAALFVPAVARATALTALLWLTIVAASIAYGLKIAVAATPNIAGDAIAAVVSAAIFALVSAWWIGAMAAVLGSLVRQSRRAAIGRAVALWLALLAVGALVPHAPVFVAHDFDVQTANLWELAQAQFAAAAKDRGRTPDQETAQRTLLQNEITGLAPRAQGSTNVYALGIAGWAGQDVFLKELDGGLAAIGGVLPIRGHAVRLVNHRETLESLPLANQRNFAAAVHALGEVMDKDADVLLLFMTSHGEPSGFDLRLPSDVVTQLTPHEVAATLSKEGIKNRVVIVSACFAGTFVPPLADEQSIVLTAADAKSTSFGCSSERDWTYFGDAFFRQSLRPGLDLQRAFDNARVLISGWELMDKAKPSNPQAHFGGALVAKLAPFFAPEAAAGH